MKLCQGEVESFMATLHVVSNISIIQILKWADYGLIVTRCRGLRWVFDESIFFSDSSTMVA